MSSHFDAIQRIPPQNVEAEQTVLGTMLLSSKSVPAVISLLDSGDFYKQNHSLIFESCCRIFKTSGGVDIVTVMDDLKIANNLERCGGPSYLASLTNVIASPLNIKKHCSIVKEHARARSIITLTTTAAEKCYEGIPAAEVYNELSGQLAKASAEDESNIETAAEISKTVLQTIEDRSNGVAAAFGIPTGLVAVDRLLIGLQKTDLILLAARPSMGKTTLAMNIVTNIAKNGLRVLVFSLEMSKEKLVEKQVSSISGVDYGKIQSGLLADEDWPRITRAMGIIHDMPLTIDDSSGLFIAQIQARAKVQALKTGIDVIMVDYLGLAKAKAESRTLEVSEISAGLKAMAKDLKIPVIALSQLNRGLEGRTDRRPMMSDLRDSGALEQDADVIGFIYRDEVYNTSEDNPVRGTAELIIAKNRCGNTGTAKLSYEGSRCRFGNLAN